MNENSIKTSTSNLEKNFISIQSLKTKMESQKFY